MKNGNPDKFLEIAHKIAEVADKFRDGKKITKADQEFIARVEKLAEVGRPAEGSNTLPVYNSMKECAAATGIPEEIQREAKAEGCDAFRYNRVHLALLLPFIWKERAAPEMAEQDADGVEKPRTIRQWLEYYKMSRERRRDSVEAGEIIDKSEVREGIQKAVSIYFGQLEKMIREMPPVIRGMDERGIAAEMRKSIDHIRSDVKARFEELEKAGTNPEVESESQE